MAFDDFCQGVSWYGPYWDHILGYWKASQERPGRILFLKYEDMKRDGRNDVKRLAEFIGYPFSVEEEKAGVVEDIIKLCSFENLSNLEVNKSGMHRTTVENRIYFRKAKDGDWENYFTEEMKEKIDKLTHQKLMGTGNIPVLRYSEARSWESHVEMGIFYTFGYLVVDTQTKWGMRTSPRLWSRLHIAGYDDQVYKKINHTACGVAAIRPVGCVDSIPFTPGSNPFVRILWSGVVSNGRIFSFKIAKDVVWAKPR
ncbi:hypothetical protein OSB04_001423 [Centaurea solstitialis]|uniref:Sulfotransferase n=1 Tax=Centaurea solstitialis TaxID=347529 RepID=A0AA38WLE9_9ASTR|nr:hypothetical protein OSB04_001423 [Centaurea solstitialis]